MDYKTVVSLSLVFILCKQCTTALKCYLCQVDTHAICSNFTDCASDEFCWLKSITLSSGDARYKSGCQKKALCPQPTIVGRRSLLSRHFNKRATTKQFCCTTNYCNGPPMTVAPPRTTASTSPTTLGQPISTGGNTCKDNLDNCAQLGQLFCSGQYLDFAKQNCQKYCNLCPGSPGAVATPKPSTTMHSEFCNYKNKKYKQGESWRDGCQYNCTCEDASVGYYTCRNLCPQYINLPPGCSLTTRYGECCAIPFCVPTMTPSIVPRSNNTCYFNGTAYAQGQKWNDGCRQSCTCADDSSGCFSCRAICLNWSQLPSTCHMEPVPPGLCCQQPRCPPPIILKIPSAYMDQYPGYTYV